MRSPRQRNVIQCFSTCVVWGNVSGSRSGRWDPQVTLKLVLIQWLASVEQDQINSSIQGTLQILNGSLDIIVEFLTLLCWCESGVLLSPWWPCDGPWATETWQWSYLKWEVCCILIFVNTCLMNTQVHLCIKRWFLLMIHDGDLWDTA